MDDLDNLTQRRRQQGHSYAGFNPARQEEIRLFSAVLAGDQIAQSLRNHDIRAAPYDGARTINNDVGIVRQ